MFLFLGSSHILAKLKKIVMKKKQTLLKIYLGEILNYIQHKADINSFGRVIAIGDGVARVFGLTVFCFLEQLDLFRKTAPVFFQLFAKSHDYLV